MSRKTKTSSVFKSKLMTTKLLQSKQMTSSSPLAWVNIFQNNFYVTDTAPGSTRLTAEVLHAMGKC